MRELVLNDIKDEMVTKEQAKTSIGTLQFGVYGTDQEFEFEVADGKSVKAIDSGIVMEIVRNFTAMNDSVRALQINRVENSEALVRRFENSCQAWMNLALSYVNTGHLEEAKKAIEKALNIEPTMSSAKALRGRILILEGNISDALKVYDEITSEKKSIPARETAALLRLALGDTDSAISQLLEAIKDDKKKRVSLYYNLGVVYLVKGSFDKAIAFFRKVITMSPDYYKAYESIGIAYIILGLEKKAEKMFKIAIEINPRDPSSRLNLARILIKQFRFDEAMVFLTGLVQEFPRLWAARHELAILKIRDNKPKEALFHFEKIADAIKTHIYDGDLSIALNNIGAAHLTARNFRLSEENLRESLRISDGKNSKAGANLVRLYITERHLEKAYEMLTELLNLHKENAEVLNLLAIYYSLIGQYDKCIQIAKDVLSKDKYNLESASIISTTLADIYDDPNGAEMILRPLEEKWSNNSKFLNNLAYALLMQDRVPEAERLLDRLKQDDEFISSIPLATRGLLFLKKGDIREGTRLYSEAAKLAFDKELANMIIQKRELELGKLYLKVGDTFKAKQHFDKVLDLDVQDKVFERKARELENELI
jgi:tetratricopeptide (TPR) repeat protein